MVSLISKISNFEKGRYPARLRLGEIDFEFWEAIEKPVQHQLNHVQAAQLVEARDLANEVGSRPLSFIVAYFLGLLWIHEQWAVALGSIELDVTRYRHIQVDGSGPEAIVVQSRIAFIAWKA